MLKKRSIIFLSLLILGILLLSSCFLKPPVTEGILKGQVIVPEGTLQEKGLTGQALPDATVNIIDPATGDIIATTTTDANGYYQVFVPAGGPYLLQAVKNGVKVQQFTPQVEVGIEYDLGTADCSTTAVALIVQAMLDAEDFPNDPADINLADIEVDPDFDDVMSIVCSAIEAGEDPALSAVVQQAVEDFLHPPTPTPTPTPPNDAKAITAFDFIALEPDVVGVISEGAKTIALTVPYGTNVTALVPTIVHTGASVSPASGTAQNFTSPVDYTVTADDATTAVYAVTVTVAPNDAKAITAFDFIALEPDVVGVISEGAKTIALTVPYGTNVTALVPTIVHTGASVSPASGTAQNFTSPVDYTVTADDATTAVYAVTVTVAPNDAKAITAFDFIALEPDVVGVISEGAKTIALTVPYGTNVTALVPTIVHTGASVSPASGTAQNFTSPVDYTVTADDATTAVYAVTVTVAPNDAKAITAFDFIALEPDVVGVISEGAKTIALTVPYGTNVTALVPTIVHTGASVSPASGTAQNFTSPVDYTVTADDATTAVYAVTVTVAPNDAKAITAFDFIALEPDVVGVISEGAKTIALTVPYGTNVTALVPTIVHTGASVSPASGTAQNFTSPVDYTVTADDATTAVYAVTVIPLAIGAPYGGGIIAYILQGGDPGYDANEQHGLIAATEDQSTGIQWYNGSYTTTGATGTALGTGSANTTTIIASQGATATDYAAGLARAHDGGGYSDWFLPSLDELNKLYLNKVAIGGFAVVNYWSSSEFNAGGAWAQHFLNGNQNSFSSKNYTYRVRAVRAF